MSLQTLTLDLAKITAYTPQTPTIRQNDAGESLPIILGRGGEAIDLTKSVVTLYLEKSSGKIIQVSSDSAPEAWTINDDGTMSVVLPPETYQAHGDIKVGYLRIKTGDLVESTSSFSIRVLPAKGSPEADDSYISDAAKIVGDIKSKDAAAQVVLEQTRAKYTELDTAMATATKAATDATNATTAATDAAGKATDATADTIEIKKSTEDLLAKIPTDPNYKGPKGDKGNQGIQGPKGLDGKSSYAHIAYANSSDSERNMNNWVLSEPAKNAATITYKNGVNTIDYTGVFGYEVFSMPIHAKVGNNVSVTFAYTQPAVVSLDGGSNGVPVSFSDHPNKSTALGANHIYLGVNAQSSKVYTISIMATSETMYLSFNFGHLRDGINWKFELSVQQDFSQDPGKHEYMGWYSDFTALDSNDPSFYGWSLIKGAKGDKGDTGEKGKDAVINVVTQAQYDALTDKSGVYFIGG